MFAFEHWANWLQTKVNALSETDLICSYRDTLDVPECASNPSCELRAKSPSHVGSFRFWKGGTCDYEVMDSATNRFVADEAALEANDDTMHGLLDRFLSSFTTDEK